MSELVDRKQFIGASDVPAIVGVSPWKTAYDVWAEKTGLVEENVENEIATTVGKYMEAGLAKYVNERIGKIVEEQKRVAYSKLEIPPVAATLDAILEDGNIVEFKTSGIISGGYGKFMREWDNDVPDYVWVQVQTQLMCAEKDKALVIALLGGRGIVDFEVYRSDKFEPMVIPILTQFWDNVEKKIAPDFSVPKACIKYLRVEKGETVELNEESAEANVLMQLCDLNEQKKQLKEEIDSIEEQIDEIEKALIGKHPSAESIILKRNNIVYRMLRSQYTRNYVDSKKLQKEFEEIYQQVLKPTLVTAVRYNVIVED